MKFDPIYESSEDNFDESISLREIFEKYIRHYKWFILSRFVIWCFSIFKTAI